MMWLVPAAIGFLVLMALVMASDTRSTRLYERAQDEPDDVMRVRGGTWAP